MVLLLWVLLIPCTQAALATPSSPLTAWLSMLQRTIMQTPSISHMQASTYFAGMCMSAYNALNNNQQAARVNEDAVVVSSACHTFMSHHFPNRIAEHDALLNRQIAETLPAKKLAASSLGSLEAHRVTASRLQERLEGSVSWQPPPAAPGVWRPDPGGDAPAEFPKWGHMKPFLLTEAEVQQATGSSVSAYQWFRGPYFQSMQYYEDLEHIRVKGSRTAAASQLPAFWADGSGDPSSTSTMTGHWVNISMQALPDSLSLYEQARFFAALTATILDTTIACFRAKYEVNLWRPSTAITQGDGSPYEAAVDPHWKAALKDPPYPAYPSSHSCIAGSATEVLRAYLGTDECNLAITSEGSPATYTFTKLSDMTLAVGASRVLGGVNYQQACKAGVLLGRNVALMALQHMRTELVVPPKEQASA